MNVPRPLAPLGLGILLVAQGLGHGVLALRGAVSGPDPQANVVAWWLMTLAILGFLAAGLGVLGARPFRRVAVHATRVSALASLVALSFLGDPDLWPGAVIDAIAVATVANVVAHRPPSPRERWPRFVGETAALGFFAYVALTTTLWPWHRAWGVTAAEQSAPMPGDRVPRTLALEMMHAVTIDAPPEAVWPWLMQIGQDRGGFYSYDWLERLFLVDIHNVDALHPEWPPRRPGDFVRATQPDYLGGLLGTDLGWHVDDVRPNEALVLRNWGAFVLRPRGTRQTRLVVRLTMNDTRIPVWAAAVMFSAFELPHFIMERRMLLGIKSRAERT